MRLYSGSSTQFMDDTIHNEIGDKLKESFDTARFFTIYQHAQIYLLRLKTEILKTPYILLVQVSPWILLKKDLIILKRCPVRRFRNQFSQIRLRDLQYMIMGKIIRNTPTLVGVLYHPHHGCHYADRDLHSGRILMRNEPSRFFYSQDASGPPRIIFMAHQ